MMRAALVAVLLLLAPVIASGAVPAPAPQPAATNGSAAEDAPINRIAHLTLGEGSSDGLANQSADVASAVSIGRADAAARLDDYATGERLGRTNRTNATLETALDEFETRVGALEAAERSVRSRYANGSTSTPAFVEEMAHVQARVERLDARLSRLDGMASQYGNATQRQRIDRLHQRFIGITGPVRGHLLAALTGERAPLELYAAGSENGTVFAAFEGSEYVRDAYRADRQQRPPDGTSIIVAFDRFQQVYPVALEFAGFVGVQGRNGNETYQFDKNLPFGSLLSYLDGNTLEVFHEIQRRDLDAMDQPASVTATANGTRLVVNRTHVGGPLRVATYDAATGNATEGTVTVGDRRLETGEDGVVRTLMPPGPQVEVSAVTPDGTVSVTVDPIELTPINSSVGS
jgi:hypothetical protein